MTKLSQTALRNVMALVTEVSDEFVQGYFNKSIEAKRADGYGFDGRDKTDHERNQAFSRMKAMNKASERLRDNADPVRAHVHDMSHMDHGEAYDYTQTHDSVKDGDVLKLAGNHSAVMYKAWPTMVHGASRAMHTLNDPSEWATMHRGRYAESHKVATQVANGEAHGKPEHKADWSLEEALKLKATHAHDDGIHTAKIYKDSDWDEHRIKYFKNGVHTGEDSDGFADSLEDANDTAKADLDHMAKHHKVDEAAVNEAKSPIKWHVHAGGTFAKDGAVGYTSRTDNGEYHINPPPAGRRGHSLMFANSAGKINGGLWHNLGTFEHPNKAKAAALTHHSAISTVSESVDDFKAPPAPTDMGNVNPIPETHTLVDYIKNATLSNEYSPLINFLKAHKVEVYQPSPDDSKNTGDVFNAASTPTYDRAAHRQGYDQEQTQAAWDQANPDVDEYEYLSRLNKVREKMYAKVHDMWKGERQ